jgi:hypothetical protein
LADTNVAINPASGGPVPVDARTVDGGDYRQVVVVGDPASSAGVAPVDATHGLSVDVTRVQSTVTVGGSVTVSGSALPTGASTAANQATEIASLASIDGKVSACNTGAVTVSSSALPSGAATSAKQPAFGTAGTPSADVISVQGEASMTPLKTDGSATTQPVSAVSLPLPTGAATSAAQTTGNSSLSSIDGKVTACNTGAVTVSSSALPSGAATAANQSTGNASLSSIDGKVTACNTGAVTVSSSALPSGAATAAKQPALGTAGTPSADVVTVQGATSMTPLKVDGSGATQPVSGTVTANIGTSGSLALDATLTGGTQKTKLVDSGGTNVATVSPSGALVVDPSAVTAPVALSDIQVALRAILNALVRPAWMDPSTGRMRIDPVNAAGTSDTITTITTCSTVTTVTTCSTVTTLSQLAGFDAKQTLLYDQSRQTWAQNVRANIT